jgi:ribose transport system substrate-binding protein
MVKKGIIFITFAMIFFSQLALGAEKPETPVTEAMLKLSHKGALGPVDMLKGTDVVIGFSQRRSESIWYDSMTEAVREQAEWMGADIIVADAEDNTNKQIKDLGGMIEKGVNAVILNPCHFTDILPAVKKIHNAGIPLIVLDTKLSDKGKPFTFVSAEQFKKGYNSGNKLAESVAVRWGADELAEIVLCAPGQHQHWHNIELVRRGLIAGYSDYMLEKYNKCNLKIADYIRGSLGDYAATKTRLENTLKLHPNIKAIMSVCVEATPIVIDALKKADRLEKVLVSAVDARKSTLEWLKSGDYGIVVASFIDPRVMGKWAVYFAAHGALGFRTPDYFETPLHSVTIENVDLYYEAESGY